MPSAWRRDRASRALQTSNMKNSVRRRSLPPWPPWRFVRCHCRRGRSVRSSGPRSKGQPLCGGCHRASAEKCDSEVPRRRWCSRGLPEELCASTAALGRDLKPAQRRAGPDAGPHPAQALNRGSRSTRARHLLIIRTASLDAPHALGPLIRGASCGSPRAMR